MAESLTTHLISSIESMAMLGFKNRSAFWQFVAKHDLPRYKLNGKVIKFKKADLEAFIEGRKVGGLK